MKKKYLALLTIFALLLTLLTACGGTPPNDGTPAADPNGPQGEAQPSASPAPIENTEPAQSPEIPDAAPVDQPDAQEPADDAQSGPEDSKPEEPAPEETQPSEPVSAPADPEPDPEPTPDLEPAPEPDPEETIPEDGTYTAAVTLEGGTGRATVESPAVLHCENGQFRAVIVWSSPNFDYMKVDGEKYELVSEPGSNSVFEIPVTAFDQKLDVIADTVAMSEPHEVEYTLYFDSATLQKQ